MLRPFANGAAYGNKCAVGMVAGWVAGSLFAFTRVTVESGETRRFHHYEKIEVIV